MPVTNRDILLPIILQKYHSLRQFSQACDIPYQTMQFLMKKPPDDINSGHLKIICAATGLSADELLQVSAHTKNVLVCTDEEREIIERCRSVPGMQEIVERVLEIEHPSQDRDSKDQ